MIILLISVICYSLFWFLLSIYFKRNDIADIAWGLGFIFIVKILYFVYQPSSITFYVIGALTSIWGFRLALHIFLRNRGKKEDVRYAEMQKNWGKLFWVRSYFQVFFLQSLLMLLISTSAIISAQTASINVVALVFGVLIWLLGFIFESVGDYQLGVFIKNPENKNKIMTSGLWKYTRHPNYFGEVTQWWGIFVIVAFLPSGFFAFISPLAITFLILKVSGIPMLEKRYANDPDYLKYKLRTNAFFPWFPKKG